MKSICIKTNDLKLEKYLLDNLKDIDIKGIIFSNCKFKVYNNVIVHYAGTDLGIFLSKIATILADSILDVLEEEIIRKLIRNNYFYFSLPEQIEIKNKCYEDLMEENNFNRKEMLVDSLYSYLEDNKTLNIEGFINFRLKEYIKFLDSAIDISVNKFIIDREYLEFIGLLRQYVLSKPFGAGIVHLIYNEQSSMILDEDNKIIEPDINAFKAMYVSDISFSSNDYALNTLLTLIPKKLIIHTEKEEDEFVNTLKLIFANRVVISK